jgi:hypothetical protein
LVGWVPIQEFLSHGNHPDHSAINKDIEQAMIIFSFLNDEKLKILLKTILLTHCQIDLEFGYKNGMIYFTGLFILYMSDEVAFWAYYNVLIRYRPLQIDFMIPVFQNLIFGAKFWL